MSQIDISHLTFCYEGAFDNIFEDVSFRIDTDWKLGFIARNGRGKTTLLKLLLGRCEYEGRITATVGFDYFPYPVEDKKEETLAVVEKLRPDYELWKICRELNLLDMEEEVLYRPFETLSSGEQTKVMLAVLFSGENRFLLIDEPTNHLDREAREIVSRYLNRKKGFLLVSHDRDFLDRCIDHVLVINKTDIEVQQGNFTSWWENKSRRDAYETAENDRLKKDIKRLQTAAGKARQWADDVEASKIGGKQRRTQAIEKNIGARAYIGEKSRRMQMRRKNLEKRQERAIEEKSSLLKNIETADDLRLYPLRHPKEVLVRMKDVSLFYGSKPVVTDFGLELKNGEKVALYGKNGCGKSSVIKAILQSAARAEESGELTVKGTVETASGLVISHVPQNTTHLMGSLDDYARACGIDGALFKTLLRKLDFSRIQFEKRMEDYSGGQKKKVLIAQSLCTKAHLYIWDEPLNFIDVFSRMQIEELIRKYNPTLLMVEHDRAFVDKIGARIVEVGI